MSKIVMYVCSLSTILTMRDGCADQIYLHASFGLTSFVIRCGYERAFDSRPLLNNDCANKWVGAVGDVITIVKSLSPRADRNPALHHLGGSASFYVFLHIIAPRHRSPIHHYNIHHSPDEIES